MGTESGGVAMGALKDGADASVVVDWALTSMKDCATIRTAMEKSVRLRAAADEQRRMVMRWGERGRTAAGK